MFSLLTINHFMMHSTLKRVYMQDPEYEELKRQRLPLLDGIEEFQKQMVHDNDQQCHLYLYLVNETPIGTARIRPTPECLKFERVAIHRDWQGKGIGKEMTQKILQNYKNDGRNVVVHAFLHVEGFYTKCGFEVEERLEEDGFTLAKMIYSFQ
jgi:predicted GNAT family N-acyltransferase